MAELKRMFETLKMLDGLDWTQLKLVLTLLAVVLCLLAAAAAAYLAQTALRPLTLVVFWMCAYTPGTRPNDLAAGMAHGIRLFVWSGLIALILWFLFR